MNNQPPENNGPQNAVNTKKSPVKLIITLLCIVIVIAALGMGLYFLQNNSVAAVISLDVNPSVEIKINKNEKVLSCTPLNAEAAHVLFELDGGKDLEGAKLELAVNAVVGAFVRNGYSSDIMVSVEDSDRERASRLKEELTNTVETVLKKENVSAEVIGDEIVPETSLESIAREQGISVGKAALIERIVKLNPSLDLEQLALLSIEELEDLLEAGAPGMPIGLKRAKEIAEEYAGAEQLDVLSVEVDSDIDDTPAVYEVEIHTQNGEFEYRVHAYTGEVLSGQPDIAALYQTETAPVSTVPITTPEETAPPQAAADTQPVPSQTTTSAALTQPIAPAQTIPAPVSYIGDEAAKLAAFTHAGISASDVTYIDCHIDYDDGHPECYEIEFVCGDICYEYDVDLYDGSIHSCSHERYHSNRHGHHCGDYCE